MMDAQRTQELVRQLITEADHLSRTLNEANQPARSWRFAALRSTLQRIERQLGGDAPQFAVRGELDLIYQRVRDLASGAGARGDVGSEDLHRMLSDAARLRREPRRIARDGAPSAPLPEPRSARPSGVFRAAGAAWAPIVLGVVAVIAPLAVAPLRRSRAWWGAVAAGVLAVAVGAAARGTLAVGDAE